MAGGGESEFDRAALRLAERAIEGAAPEPGDLEVLVRGMTRLISALGSNAAEAKTLATDAVDRFWEAARRGLVDPNRRPGAYLTVISRNLATAELRKSSIASPAPEGREGGMEDIELEAVLERAGALATLDELRRQAVRDRDYVAVRVLTAWLDLANASRSSPTSRQVAMEAGLSHATVNRALERLRVRL